MIIKTDQFKNVCNTILAAIDNNEISTLTTTLELKTVGKTLYLNVTNGEYFASVKFDLTSEEVFNAAVNANLFLKLIAAVTSEDIEFTLKDNYVLVKANGSYKIPLIFDNDKLLELPKIEIANKTLEMKVSGSILESILNYNSKELLRGAINKPVQKMFYVDEKGCITFTTGACVNKFTLEKPLKVLFNSRLVKLFKLFKNDMVDFTLGYDPISEDLIQTKVQFANNNITLTAITGCNDELLKSVPVAAIRNTADAEYTCNVVLNKTELEETINRLLLFSAGYGSAQNLKPYSLFECGSTEMTIYDTAKENKETIKYKNNTNIEQNYNMTLDLADLKLILDSISEEYVTLAFGNHRNIVIRRTGIYNVVPEVKTVASA